MGGRLTVEDLETYQFGTYRMVTIEKGEGLYTDRTLNTLTDDSFAEERMIDACRLVKESYPGMTCYIYFNALLSWRYYRMADDYVELVENNKPPLIDWARGGDTTFPDNRNLAVFDFRETIAKDWFINRIREIVDGSSDVVDGIFLDRGYINKGNEADGTKAGWGTNNNLKLSNNLYFNSYTEGKNEVLNEIENIGIKTVVNPGSHYYNDHSSVQDSGYTFATKMQNAHMIHLEKACVGTVSDFRDTVYKVHMAAVGGKEVQFHGGMITCDGNYVCKDNIRRAISAYLLGASKDIKSYFSCHEYWQLDRDESNNMGEFLGFQEYDLPLGVPGNLHVVRNNGVLQTMNTFTLEKNWNSNVARPFFHPDTNAVQAVAVFSVDVQTVCYRNTCVANSVVDGRRCQAQDSRCDAILDSFDSFYTLRPTSSPTTFIPTRSPTTKSPTKSPTTRAPTNFPTTRAPTTSPPTSPPGTPTKSPTTPPPTKSPTTLSPTISPTTKAPTTGSPTVPPGSPSKSPTRFPTESPSKLPTKSPTSAPPPTTTSALNVGTTTIALAAGGGLGAVFIGVLVYLKCTRQSQSYDDAFTYAQVTHKF